MQRRFRNGQPVVRLAFLVDVVEYLWKGGRCGSIAAFGATMLKLKPRIDVLQGKDNIRTHQPGIKEIYVTRAGGGDASAPGLFYY